MKHLIRQWDLIPHEKLDTPITVIGAGAIGGLTVLTLAKMGFKNITAIDFDRVEIENVGVQFFRFSDIGKQKVVALQEIVKDFAGIQIKPRDEKYAGKESFAGIVISAVDSMAVRKLIWDKHKGMPATKIVIDPRMGAETGLMYAMDPTSPKDIASYEKTLYSDRAASHEPCTAKATYYTASMLSGLVAKTAKDVAAKQEYTRTATWSIKSSQFTGWLAGGAPALVPAAAVV